MFSLTYLSFTMYSVQPPRDIFELFIDGESVQSLVSVQEFTEIPMGLAPGPHVINFHAVSSHERDFLLGGTKVTFF